ncbi:MAG: hypothetical protein GDA46_00725 [Bdellovibrionales bacterium]|nr:hypothetical protein [Bdellovibrionales bacterium]
MFKIFQNRLYYLVILTFFKLISFSCFANKGEDVLSHPLFLSVSGSGGARINEDDSYLINPALLAFHKKKKLTFSYSFKKNQQIALLSVVDNKRLFPMAISYQRFWSHSFQEGAENVIFFSSSFKTSPFLSFGLNIERNLNPFFWNASIGSFLRFNSHFSGAVFLDKILIEKGKNLRTLSFATFYRWRNFFSIQGDLSRSARKEWIFKTAVESLFYSFFSVQLGTLLVMKDRDQKIQRRVISGGINFYSPRFLLKYGLQQSTQKSYQHGLTLLIRF